MDDRFNSYESLSFENINSTTLNEENIGGPPIPMYEGCTSIITNTNDNLTNEQKHAAYMAYVNNHGYVPFDYTELTTNTANTANTIVNNTAFFVFFSMFLLFIIMILILIVYGHLDIIVGLHLIILFSLIIYVMSMLYRHNTLSIIKTSSEGLNNSIAQNKINFENSIIQLPNNIMTISNLLKSTTPTNTTQSIMMSKMNPCADCHEYHSESTYDCSSYPSNPSTFTTSCTSSCSCSSESECSSDCSCSLDSDDLYTDST